MVAKIARHVFVMDKICSVSQNAFGAGVVMYRYLNMVGC